MGLGIIVYTNLERHIKEYDDIDVFYEDTEDSEENIIYLDPPTPNSPVDRSDGLTRGAYKAVRSYDFCAGSYGGYNHWRNRLSEIMLGVPADVVWNSPNSYKQFVELINFSDCAGFIGPKTSAKLAKDFEQFRYLLPSDDEDFVDRYDCWATAFKLASENNGIVYFS